MYFHIHYGMQAGWIVQTIFLEKQKKVLAYATVHSQFLTIVFCSSTNQTLKGKKNTKRKGEKENQKQILCTDHLTHCTVIFLYH
jgi:hypothetical protein